MREHDRKSGPLPKGFRLLIRVSFLIVLVLIAAEIADAGPITYFFQSPLPTPTNTPAPIPPTPTNTPIPPTNTPPPPTPTNTPNPNSPPVIDAISGPSDPVDVNDQPVEVMVAYSDPDIGDTHIITWDWGDSSPDDTQTNATSPAVQRHTYAGQGVYSVQVTVTDTAGATDSDTFEFIILFDPENGFVTGGGWYVSPAGAYTPDDPNDPDLTGPASFGFVSKYRRGAGTPDGDTLFQFQAGDLNFNSDNYQWLVITENDTVARFKGEGAVNGSEPIYKFLIWAGDGDPDTFHIKIWLETPSGELPLYDNGTDQPINGGSIVIHNGR